MAIKPITNIELVIKTRKVRDLLDEIVDDLVLVHSKLSLLEKTAIKNFILACKEAERDCNALLKDTFMCSNTCSEEKMVAPKKPGERLT